MNKLIILFCTFFSISTKLYCQSINLYGSLYDLSAGKQSNLSNKIYKNTHNHTRITFSLGLSYLEKNKINYLELLLSSNETIYLQTPLNNKNFNSIKYPSPPRYGVIIGRGKYFTKSKKLTLFSSIFLQIAHQSSNMARIETVKTNQGSPSSYYHRVNTEELPNQFQLFLGYRFGISYNITPRLFFNLNFDFSGGYIKTFGDTKSTFKTYNYQNELLDETIILKETDGHHFKTRLFVPHITVGYTLWESPIHR